MTAALSGTETVLEPSLQLPTRDVTPTTDRCSCNNTHSQHLLACGLSLWFEFWPGELRRPPREAGGAVLRSIRGSESCVAGNQQHGERANNFL